MGQEVALKPALPKIPESQIPNTEDGSGWVKLVQIYTIFAICLSTV